MTKKFRLHHHQNFYDFCMKVIAPFTGMNFLAQNIKKWIEKNIRQITVMSWNSGTTDFHFLFIISVPRPAMSTQMIGCHSWSNTSKLLMGWLCYAVFWRLWVNIREETNILYKTSITLISLAENWWWWLLLLLLLTQEFCYFWYS